VCGRVSDWPCLNFNFVIQKIESFKSRTRAIMIALFSFLFFHVMGSGGVCLGSEQAAKVPFVLQSLSLTHIYTQSHIHIVFFDRFFPRQE
jgi:hypothetical protein